MGNIISPVQTVDNPIDYDALPLNSRHRFAYEVALMADGSNHTIPVVVLVGRAYRPRLVCVAAVHGDEQEGVSALMELCGELEPDSITGTLVMVPVANPPAFRANTHRNPEDMVDMNRAFPGKADGSTTEKLAHDLFHGIVTGADQVLSMHGWPEGGVMVPYTEYPQGSSVTEASRDAAYDFGLEYVEAYVWPHGVIGEACMEADIPVIEVEIGGLGCTVPERRSRYKRGVHNLMKHLGMEPGEPEVPETVHEIKSSFLYTPIGGVVQRHIELGSEVHAGECVFTIADLTGEPQVRIETPVDGIVGGQLLRASVSPGERIAFIFQLLT